ncbi:hypothetical protein H8959_017989 [Pygathrix nigripes]
MSVIGSRKKSVNMTECVPVPSSEHVAEIVGRQGCKIKALRAKTNTYIKTPVRGEEPVFIVTGRKEDVEMAKREILSAAEHFSIIRATRSKAGGLPGTAQGPPNLPGQTTIQVRVPYRVVGLVVGPKGATIKRIQQRTHTYIVTPGRDKEPVFAVTGMPENCGPRARGDRGAHSHCALAPSPMRAPTVTSTPTAPTSAWTCSGQPPASGPRPQTQDDGPPRPRPASAGTRPWAPPAPPRPSTRAAVAAPLCRTQAPPAPTASPATGASLSVRRVLVPRWGRPPPTTATSASTSWRWT